MWTEEAEEGVASDHGFVDLPFLEAPGHFPVPGIGSAAGVAVFLSGFPGSTLRAVG